MQLEVASSSGELSIAARSGSMAKEKKEKKAKKEKKEKKAKRSKEEKAAAKAAKKEKKAKKRKSEAADGEQPAAKKVKPAAEEAAAAAPEPRRKSPRLAAQEAAKAPGDSFSLDGGGGREFVGGGASADAAVLEPAEYRAAHSIVCKGEGVPDPFQKFSDAPWPEAIQEAIRKAGFESPSGIQSQCWPVGLAGKDMIGVAKTGSGKTLGFLLPLFNHIETTVGKQLPPAGKCPAPKLPPMPAVSKWPAAERRACCRCRSGPCGCHHRADA